MSAAVIDDLAIVPGRIGLKCPMCDAAKIAQRMAIDPPVARLAFYPCTDCDDGKREVIYTNAQRNPIPL